MEGKNAVASSSRVTLDTYPVGALGDVSSAGESISIATRNTTSPPTVRDGIYDTFSTVKEQQHAQGALERLQLLAAPDDNSDELESDTDMEDEEEACEL
jgi:hypothetical protein